jgi:hypothetical protein
MWIQQNNEILSCETKHIKWVTLNFDILQLFCIIIDKSRRLLHTNYSLV